MGSWTESMSQGLAISEGTRGLGTRTMAAWMERPDMSVKMKAVVEYNRARASSRCTTLRVSNPR